MATTVTVVVTPTNAGDFRGEMPRQVDIRLVPQGIILPINPNLVAAFTFTPAAPQVVPDGGVRRVDEHEQRCACLTLCTYAWDFGDGTSAVGTHDDASVPQRSGIFAVTLTVTDPRGAVGHEHDRR